MTDYRSDDIFQQPTPDNQTKPDKRPPKEKRSGQIRILGMSLSFVFLLLYVILSLCNGSLWGKLWIGFLLVPVLNSIPLCVVNRSPKYFHFSTLILFSYLVLGMFFGIWHPTWLLFLAIPLWEAYAKGKSIRLFEVEFK